jgi:hypothetical protein
MRHAAAAPAIDGARGEFALPSLGVATLDDSDRASFDRFVAPR